MQQIFKVFVYIVKTMKGRVGKEISKREPGQVRTGTEGFAEHGPRVELSNKSRQ
jgi:hypothetical protein